MGFFATVGRGWEMSKLSMGVVKKDPELMVYMILAGLMSLAHIPCAIRRIPLVGMSAVGQPQVVSSGTVSALVLWPG